MTIQLSAADVERLADQKNDADIRAETLQKIADGFSAEDMTDSQRALATDIFRVMAQDVEIRVRQALAEGLRQSPNIPPDLARQIANDVADVAVPFIEMTSVLTDDDLLEIIRTKGADHQMAVARRPTVSQPISDALVDTHNEAVVATLVANAGADLSEGTMARVVEEFGHVRSVSVPLAERNALPLSIAERLITLVSDKMQARLDGIDAVEEQADSLVTTARERATVSLLDGAHDAPDIHALVEQLYRSKRLSHTLLVHALCMGDVVFFEAALAKLSGLPVNNVFRLVHDKGAVGLQRLFKKIGISQQLADISLIALDLVNDMSLDGRDDRDHFRAVMLDRVLTQLGDSYDAASLEFLLNGLNVPNVA